MFPKRRATATPKPSARWATVLAGCLATMLAPAPALALDPPDMSVIPSLPAAPANVVAVGDAPNLGGKLTIKNSSDPLDPAYLTLNTVTVVPSCGGTTTTDGSCVLAAGAGTGVLTLGSHAVGVAGACNDRAFTVQEIDAATGKYSFTTSPAIQLSASGGSSTCGIAFTYDVKRMPTYDSAADPGQQTELLAYVSATPTGRSAIQAVRPLKLTVEKDTPSLTVRAIQSGGQLSAEATLGGTQPNGTMTIDLHGPDDTTCTGALLSTREVAVSGAGTHQSFAMAVPPPGTYRWKAHYGGDEDNRAVGSVCGDPASTTVIGPPVTQPPPPTPTPGAGTTPGSGDTTPGATTPGTRTTPGPGVKRVRLDAFALTRRTFARAATATALAANAAYVAPKRRQAAKKGTTIKYTLSAPATVTIVVERVTKGRRAGGHANTCVKATAKLKRQRAKVCTLYTKVATLKRAHRRAGAKKVAFSGRAGRRALAVGSYRLRATAAAGAGTASAERRTTFKIVKR